MHGPLGDRHDRSTAVTGNPLVAAVERGLDVCNILIVALAALAGRQLAMPPIRRFAGPVGTFGDGPDSCANCRICAGSASLTRPHTPTPNHAETLAQLGIRPCANVRQIRRIDGKALQMSAFVS